MTAIVLDNWAAIYFLAVTIKTKETSEKYLCKVACTVISLMNERSVADVDSSIDFDQAIESAELDPDDAVEEVYDDQSEASPPTFYLMLLWNRAFCDYAFNPNWRFILKDDPYFGSFGQCARLMAERTVVIYNQAAELKPSLDKDSSGQYHLGGWKTNPAFKKYSTAVSRMPTNTKDGLVNREFFEKSLPIEFLDKYLASIKKGMCDRWWSNDLIYYVLGGDPILAKEFAKMLMHYKHEYEIKEANQGYIVVPYPYTDIINTTILGAHHNMTDNEDGAIKLDVKTTLQLMTGSAKFDWEKVVNKPFVKTYWDEIVMLASVDGFADMFQLKEDGKYLICLS